MRSVRIIQVGNSRAGVTGLDQLLEQISLEGWAPDDEGLAKRLVGGLRTAGNYVAQTAEAAYAQSLLDLYRAYATGTQKPESRCASEVSVKR
jgi:hypothetical protein